MFRIIPKTIRLFFLLLALATTLGVSGQSHNDKIIGQIISSTTKQGVESVSVLMMEKGGAVTHGFSLTNKEGTYSFFRPKVGPEVELELHISGFNVESKIVPISLSDNNIIIEVEQKIMEIREVVVQSTAESRKGDTVSFVASSYRGSNDRVIGDLLKRIPGIEVTQSGTINYGGESINTFYVEDMDMLGGRYSVAVNNISAEDIASVQIYENHQPVAALRGLSNTNKAAINIRLKDSAKGTLSGSLLLGGGSNSSSPLYQGAATAAYFNSRLQTIATYKTNNVGEDITLELQQNWSMAGGGPTALLSITTPSTPPLPQERFLNNHTHTASLNSMVRLKKGVELIANISFAKDRRLYEGNQHSVYLLPAGNSIAVSEQSSANNESMLTDAMLTIRSNGKKCHIQNKLMLSVEALEAYGDIVANDEHTNQHHTLPWHSVANNFEVTSHLGNWMLNLNSLTSFKHSTEELTIIPLPFEQLFPNNNAATGAQQSVTTSGLATTNRLSAGYQIGRWNIGLWGEFTLKEEDMQSALRSTPTDESNIPTEYRNNIHFVDREFSVGPYVHYISGNRLQVRLNLPLQFIDIDNSDLLREVSNQLQKISPSPTLTITANPWRNIGLNASVSRMEMFGSLYRSYGGYIMSNYRQVGTMGGIMPHSFTNNYTLSLTYNNLFYLLSASIRGGYMQINNNVIYNTSYDGILMRIDGLERDNKGSQWYLRGKVSKRLRPIYTTFTLTTGMSSSQNEVLCEGKLVGSTTEQLSTELTFVSTPLEWAELTYAGVVNAHLNTFNHQRMNPIVTLHQQAEIKVSLSKLFGQGGRLSADRLNCFLSGQHFHNKALNTDLRNIFFVDAGLGWRGERFEWLLRGQNLLDYNAFSSSSQRANLDYTYTYALRPRSFIAEVRFTF